MHDSFGDDAFRDAAFVARERGRSLPGAGARGARPRWRRSGLTLLEVCLVLVLLVVMALLVRPMLEGPLDGRRLRLAADTVRAEWAAARNRAMRTGEVQAFHLCQGTGQHRTERFANPSGDLETDLPGASGAAVGATSTGDPNEAPVINGVRVKTLSERVVFYDLLVQNDVRSQQYSLEDSTAAAGLMTTGTWMTPILFYPDGTCSSARVVLQAPRGRSISIDLRGVTGTTLLGPVLSAEQTPAPGSTTTAGS
jgi:Tfp pilus assembly protein FimT